MRNLSSTRRQTQHGDVIAGLRAKIANRDRARLAEIDREAAATRAARALAVQHQQAFDSWLVPDGPVVRPSVELVVPELPWTPWEPIITTKEELDFVFGPGDSERKDRPRYQPVDNLASLASVPIASLRLVR
jgi:hypothetical protein